MTDPITAASAGISLVKGAADLSRKMYELWKESKDHNVKQQLSEMLDQLTVLKQQAAALEEQNRELKEALRFKSDEYEFKNPFYFDKNKPTMPLCPKCFTEKRIAPMSQTWQGSGGMYSKCLACSTIVEINKRGNERSGQEFELGGGPEGWMAR